MVLLGVSIARQLWIPTFPGTISSCSNFKTFPWCGFDRWCMQQALTNAAYCSANILDDANTTALSLPTSSLDFYSMILSKDKAGSVIPTFFRPASTFHWSDTNMVGKAPSLPASSKKLQASSSLSSHWHQPSISYPLPHCLLSCRNFRKHCRITLMAFNICIVIAMFQMLYH